MSNLARDVATFPPRMQVLAIVAGTVHALAYCPLLREIAEALDRSRPTISHHIAALHDDRLIVHYTGSLRCITTDLGRNVGLELLNAHRTASNGT